MILTEKLNASKVKNWNSLNHITLIVELEAFCKLSFTTEELVKLNNVGDFVNLLIKKTIVYKFQDLKIGQTLKKKFIFKKI